MDVVFHIGYPKAASTTLQKHLFCCHSDLNSLALFPRKNAGLEAVTRRENIPYLESEDLRKFYKALLSGYDSLRANAELVQPNLVDALGSNDQSGTLSKHSTCVHRNAG